jgi:hypothetical protein
MFDYTPGHHDRVADQNRIISAWHCYSLATFRYFFSGLANEVFLRFHRSFIGLRGAIRPARDAAELSWIARSEAATNISAEAVQRHSRILSSQKEDPGARRARVYRRMGDGWGGWGHATRR